MLSDQEPQTSAVADFLAILEDHKKSCERAGKYVEAEIAKKRLEELRQHEENRREEDLRSRQIAQRLGIEEAHMLEFQQFNAMWDRTMKEYEERAGELLEAMRQRHELDAQEFRAKHTATPSAPKQSSKLLDLRRIERTLAKQGQYVEAQKVKVRADALEAAEAERAAADRGQHLAKLENGLMQRQDQEVNALRQRIQTGAEEQRVARQQDLERLLRRYHNIKAELESQQNAERLRQRKGLQPFAMGSSRAGGSQLGSRATVRGDLLTRCHTGGSSTASERTRPMSVRGATSLASLQQQTRPASTRPSSARIASSSSQSWQMPRSEAACSPAAPDFDIVAPVPAADAPAAGIPLESAAID